MIKKFCLIFLILFILLISTTPIDATNDNMKSLALGDSLRSNSVIIIQPNETTLQQKMIPLGKYVIPVNITYNIEGPLANFMQNILKSKTVKIDLIPVDYPDWCNVNINPKTVTADISTTKVDIKEELSITLEITEDALAFETGTIKINASANEVKGLLNGIIWIKQKNFQDDFSITVDYKPNIIVTPKNKSFEISPVNITNTTINIENLGNGKTTVLINISEQPNGWDISIPQFVDVKVNEKININLTVKPLKNFDQNNINLTFTPFYYMDITSEDATNENTKIGTYKFKNDGSYKEEKQNGFEISSTILLIIIIIVLVIILLLIGIKLIRK